MLLVFPPFPHPLSLLLFHSSHLISFWNCFPLLHTLRYLNFFFVKRKHLYQGVPYSLLNGTPSFYLLFPCWVHDSLYCLRAHIRFPTMELCSFFIFLVKNTKKK
uniref:Uncharacterized protein n=1 Tax=Trypanosoma congolense (strain IL3000) TaxID=1068625 RepID=G0UNG8_TRYCI|nr:hypothetical protein, unlikely [Trypanosoma congolense IL3000]